MWPVLTSTDLHPLNFALGEPVHVLHLLVDQRIALAILDYLMDVHDDFTLWANRHAQRLNTRVDNCPLAEPIGSDAFVTVHGTAFHAIWPLDIRPHQREDIFDSSLVKRSIRTAYERVRITDL